MKVKYGGCVLRALKSRTTAAHYKLTYDKPNDRGKERKKRVKRERIVPVSGVPSRGGLGCSNPPPPEIPKISVESSIA